ncbi:MAG TPA: hypothetical protein VFA56_12070 [Gaiellaceae bacterium]|nr:hypothetical protein [Gaiellaceae bacterium]
MRLFRRRTAPPPIGEAEAYARLHGDRGEDIVRIAPLPPPAPKPRRPRVTGETLRRAFEQRLAGRGGGDPT